MSIALLEREGFLKVGYFKCDEDRLIVFAPSSDAPRPRNVLYAYVHDGRVTYFGETGSSAVARNLAVAGDTRRKVCAGKPLVGAAWQLLSAVERAGVVEVWTGPTLNDASRQARTRFERSHMIAYDTLHPSGWNEYSLESEVAARANVITP